MKGSTASQVVQDAMADLNSLKRPLATKFTKPNPIHPFEDASSLEFFAEKNDTSMLVFGCHSKKRPHCLTFIRTFNYKMLDMLELYLDPESFQALKQFKTKKFAVGLKPLVLFAGTPFESPTPNAYTLAKSLFLDFFRGQDMPTIDVEGLQYVVSIMAGEEREGERGPRMHLRVYMIRTKKSGQKLPRVEVEETGPRMDFRVGRMKEAEPAMMKEALKQPKGLEVRCVLSYPVIARRRLIPSLSHQAKSKKNIETDIVGDKMGRIHLGRQDLGTLQTRKMKGLKRARDVRDEAKDEDQPMPDAEEDDNDSDSEPNTKSIKIR